MDAWSLWVYPAQINDFEEIRKFRAIEKIYTEKAENLTAEFKLYLANQYPDHEIKIFNKVKPANVSQYLALYPQIRSSETITLLVKNINELQNDIYNQQIKIVEYMKRVRFRKINPWNIKGLVPDVPEEFIVY